MRGIAAGTATIAEADMDAYLAAATPLQFWRRKRGPTLVRLAKALGVQVDDLVGQAAGDEERAPGAT